MKRNIISMTLADFMAATEDYLNMQTFKPEASIFRELDESKLTRWFHSNEPKPTEAGEYNASMARNPTMLRWWNGSEWSRAYSSDDTEEFKALRRKQVAGQLAQVSMLWRGLAAPPASH